MTDEVRDEAGHVLQGPYKHLRVMERRKEYLRKRIDEAARAGKTLSHDQHEVDALEWAITTIYEWVDLPEVEE